MNARTAVLRVIHEDDGSAVAESVILDHIPNDEQQSAKSALQGLTDAGVLDTSGVWGGDTFYNINRNVGEAELRQALETVGPGEVADKIMEQSSLFGDPTEARRGGDDIFEKLL